MRRRDRRRVRANTARVLELFPILGRRRAQRAALLLLSLGAAVPALARIAMHSGRPLFADLLGAASGPGETEQHRAGRAQAPRHRRRRHPPPRALQTALNGQPRSQRARERGGSQGGGGRNNEKAFHQDFLV